MFPLTATLIVPQFQPTPIVRRRLGEMLIARELIRPADLANALTLQAQNSGLLGLNLVRLGAVSEAQLLEVLSDQLGLGVLAPEDGPTPDQIAALLEELRSPLSWWTQRDAVAWRDPSPEGGGRILCAAVQPMDPMLAERLAQGVDAPVVFLLAQRALI